VTLGGRGFGGLSARGELGEPMTRSKAGLNRGLERELQRRGLDDGLRAGS